MVRPAPDVLPAVARLAVVAGGPAPGEPGDPDPAEPGLSGAAAAVRPERVLVLAARDVPGHAQGDRRDHARRIRPESHARAWPRRAAGPGPPAHPGSGPPAEDAARALALGPRPEVGQPADRRRGR